MLAVFGVVALAGPPHRSLGRRKDLAGTSGRLRCQRGAARRAGDGAGAGRQEGARLLDWQTAERIPWGTLVLFGGGIALASAFGTSGVSAYIAERLVLLRELPLPLMLFGLCLGVTLLSEIASNTAAAALLMPILAAAAAAADVDPLLFMLPAALAASLGFMLPVATAPTPSPTAPAWPTTAACCARAGSWTWSAWRPWWAWCGGCSCCGEGGTCPDVSGQT